MFCCKCGTKLADNVKFCYKCGAPTVNNIPADKTPQKQFRTVALRCQDCGGIMEVDEDGEIMQCPYCGSKRIVEVSDTVRIEKIRSKHQLEEKKLELDAKTEKEKSDDKSFFRDFALLYLFIIIIMAFTFLINFIN